VTQAIALGRGGRLRFVSVSDATGWGLNRTALLGRPPPRRRSRPLRERPARAGLRPRHSCSRTPIRVLALGAAVQGDDLLVIGTPGGQAELGATGRRAVTQVPGTLLIARRPARGGFPGLVGLFAEPFDGLRQAQTARRVAGAFGRGVLTFEDDHGGAADRRRLAERAVAVMDATGVEPVFMSAPGHQVSRLADQVRRSGGGLLIVSRHPPGHGRLPLAERLAREVRCSVPLVPPGPDSIAEPAALRFRAARPPRR
jgi:hypothetical protein